MIDYLSISNDCSEGLKVILCSTCQQSLTVDKQIYVGSLINCNWYSKQIGGGQQSCKQSRALVLHGLVSGVGCSAWLGLGGRTLQWDMKSIGPN